jgi:hypothetical protein
MPDMTNNIISTNSLKNKNMGKYLQLQVKNVFILLKLLPV